MAIPDSFPGLSTEYWAVPAWAQRSSVLDRVLSLLHVPGDGSVVLRIGGDSASQAPERLRPLLALDGADHPVRSRLR